ncbi:similar to Saccharomyces cerevisiae YPL064C CWC27 Component of a complex containing Cef1p, putatively involved in pre-mRNA splicing [Maudiozyma saulgeensis]|uniref:Similar to Saccharomyces cerevisiae YPL064C CWC27 Component of a complex containing Cef1p, putatively involved in pre-mRNA splicing n=1 Tax=Maudiozyma saulgeensis TaxID=1789683 RepID=A0A1X7R6G4_9SACH|nr:similar to Saccharomyces cerevisiae YPL064C CWC27 Component of a complex containing Cef1p, putatively involved in pre-mRNA splicing [Kazachstania saulgeensis]
MSGLRTTAKCVIHTTKGELEVELWAKECPLTCRYFLESSQRGNFNGATFNNYMKGKYLSLVHPADHSDIDAVRSVEYNSRLIVSQDGILCWNLKENTLIISTKEWPNHSRNEFTVFGKIVGQSIYTLRGWLTNDLDDDSGGTKFIYPAIIKGIEITIPYFNDLRVDEPAKMKSVSLTEPPRKRLKSMAKVKLSFDDDDEGEENDDSVLLKSKIKMKASPLLNRKQKKPSTKKQVESHEVVNKKGKEIPMEKLSKNLPQDSGEPEKSTDTVSTNQNALYKKLDPMALLAKMKASNNGKSIFS